MNSSERKPDFLHIDRLEAAEFSKKNKSYSDADKTEKALEPLKILSRFPFYYGNHN